MSKFLITGGAGFIGSNYLHMMVKKYPEDIFVCLDALTYAGNMNTIDVLFSAKNFKFIHENICNKEAIFSIFNEEKFDYVINFAAETHVDRSIENPEIFLQTNVIGTEVLMDASLKYGIKRFHQISTDEVYGDLPLNKPELLFNENTPIHASSPYSASKASADLLVLAYHRTFSLNVTISRCSNNYGPYQFMEKLIPLMISKAFKNEPLPVYGAGSNVRDWLFVGDHCDAIDKIVRYGRNGEVYNIGGNNEKSNIEIVNTILNVLNKPKSLITFVKDRPGHDLRYAIDATKIRKELNWTPKYNFEEGIKYTIDWYTKNPDWIKNIEDGEYLNWMKRHYKD